MKAPPLVSIVIPTLNEAGTLDHLLGPFSHCLGDDVDCIVVDGGSEDETSEIADRYQVQLLTSTRGRAAQMNAGWRHATGRLVWFLHADTGVPLDAIDQLKTLSQQNDPTLWGRFDLTLDDPRWPYRMIAWFINQRSRLTGISTGDQGQFAMLTLLEQTGGFPEQPLMEDIDFSKIMKRQAPPVNLPQRLTTSARRWQRKGVVRTIVLMWGLRLAHAVGVSPDRLARWYRSVR